MTTDAASRRGQRQAARRNSRASFREAELSAVLLAGDLLAGGVAAALAPPLWTLVDPEFAPRVDLRVVEMTFVLIWTLLLRITGGGGLAMPRFGRRTLSAVTRTALASSVLVLAMFFFVPFFAPRGLTLLTLVLLSGTALIWRYGYLRALGSRVLERRVAIVGTDAAARRTAAAIQRWEGPMRYRLVAFFSASDSSGETLFDTPIVTLNEQPWTTIGDVGVDLLVVGHTRSTPPALLAELTRCFEYRVEAVPATTLYEQLTGRVLAAALEADWYAALPTYAHGFYIPVKRVVDIMVALAVGALAVLLTPFIALATMLDSGRPVIYRQVRVGLRGEPFVLHKFRTMRPDAESDGAPQWSTLGDVRITRVGAFLRRMRLDELPQLWDVLLGRMSLIGPRPERPEFVARLAQELPVYRARSLVRPGISGWAQVQYPYAASVEENLAKLEYDLYYIRHLGMLLDVSIALRTIQKVFSLSGR